MQTANSSQPLTHQLELTLWFDYIAIVHLSSALTAFIQQEFQGTHVAPV